ncbi:MAG: hypothetical protein ABII80_03905 [bacterium]
MKLNRFLPGQTILEVLIATALIAISIIAALSLNNSSQKTSSYSRDLNSATTYNNQVIDWLRNLRTQMGWASLTSELVADGSNPLTYCLNSLPTTPAEFSSLSGGSCAVDDFLPGTIFTRQAEIDLDNLPNSIYVIVTTSWQSNIEHSTTTEATLTNGW